MVNVGVLEPFVLGAEIMKVLQGPGLNFPQGRKSVNPFPPWKMGTRISSRL